MSIKTLRKRIALVAVAAMGSFGLTVVPAQGAIIAAIPVDSINLAKQTETPTTGAAVKFNVGVKMVAGYTNAANTDETKFVAQFASTPAGGIVALTGAHTCADGATAATYPTAFRVASTAASGAKTYIRAADNTTATTATAVTASATACSVSYSFTPTVAGTYLVTVWNDSDDDNTQDGTEVSQQISLTVAAAAAFSTGTSSALMRGDNTDNTTADATTDALAVYATRTMAATNRAQITVSLKDSNNVAMASGNLLSASVAGPGYLVWDSSDNTTDNDSCSATPTYSATTNRAITAQAADAVGHLYVCSDGTAGDSTITVSITNAAGITAVLATKKVTFYSSVTKLEVSSKVRTILRAGGYWQSDADTAAELRDRSAVNIPSVVVKMTDSAGRLANASAEPTVVSGNTAVIAQGVCGLDDGLDAVYSSGLGVGYYNCAFQSATSAKSGDKATATIRIVDPAGDGTTYLTTTVEVTVGGSVAKETLSFDKAAYAPGEAMILTFTAVDSAGNPVYDGAASPAISFSKAVGGTAPAASVYNGGKKASSTSAATAAVFAPTVSGAFSASATSGNAAGDTITASASVANPIDAQIAALVAAIAKLQKAINKIQKRLAR